MRWIVVIEGNAYGPFDTNKAAEEWRAAHPDGYSRGYVMRLYGSTGKGAWGNE